MYGEAHMSRETWEQVKKDPRDWYEMSNPGWTQKFARVKTGIRISYCVMGPENGTPVVLCHGNTDCRISWSHVAPILAHLGFYVIVPEKRNHGLSSRIKVEKGYFDVKEELVEDLVGLLDYLHIEKASFVGHSAGGFLVGMLGVTYPERVNSITLVDSGSLCPEFRRGYKYHNEVDMDSLDLRLSMCEARLDDYEFQAGNAKHLIENLNAETLIETREEFSHPQDYNILKLNESVTYPVQMFWGTADPIISRDVIEKTRASFKNTTVDYIEIEGGSHSFFWDSWEEIGILVSHLVPFLRKANKK